MFKVCSLPRGRQCYIRAVQTPSSRNLPSQVTKDITRVTLPKPRVHLHSYTHTYTLPLHRQLISSAPLALRLVTTHTHTHTHTQTHTQPPCPAVGDTPLVIYICIPCPAQLPLRNAETLAGTSENNRPQPNSPLCVSECLCACVCVCTAPWRPKRTGNGPRDQWQHRLESHGTKSFSCVCVCVCLKSSRKCGMYALIMGPGPDTLQLQRHTFTSA